MSTRVKVDLLREGYCRLRGQGRSCYLCRTNETWRGQLDAYMLPEGWPQCPHGVTAATAAEQLPVEYKPKPQVSDIGDRYRSEMKAAFGGIPCGTCEAERKRLNTLTVGEAEAEFDQIVEATIRRAKNSPHVWDSMRARVADVVIPAKFREMIGSCLRRAIDGCRGEHG
ncbi:MAG: hypothetical protein GC154_15905 [bacterium]|nr:hypothetical protein [bacterium]